MEVKCINCAFSEIVVKEGDLFTVLDPHGIEVNKKYDQSVYICRAGPPIAGDWPHVTEDDWCGGFKPND
jgi:hypothetical protein